MLTHLFFFYRVRIGKDEEPNEESNSSTCFLGSPINVLHNDENNKKKLNSTSKKVLQKDFSKVYHSSNQNKTFKDQDENVAHIQCKCKELMDYTQPVVNKKDIVNIPMTEFSGSPLKNFAHVKKLNNKDIDASLNIQSPDYGIETVCIKQESFYDSNIKFVDDDDDEYVD